MGGYRVMQYMHLCCSPQSRLHFEVACGERLGCTCTCRTTMMSACLSQGCLVHSWLRKAQPCLTAGSAVAHQAASCHQSSCRFFAGSILPSLSGCGCRLLPCMFCPCRVFNTTYGGNWRTPDTKNRGTWPETRQGWELAWALEAKLSITAWGDMDLDARDQQCAKHRNYTSSDYI
jgi:hypothetical protein